MSFIGNAIGAILSGVFGIIMAVLCVLAPICLFRTLSKIDASKAGSGKNTRTVNRGMTAMLTIVGITVVIGLARVIVHGNDIYGMAVIAINLICLVVLCLKSGQVKKEDAQNKRAYQKQHREDVADDIAYKTDMANAKGQLKANRLMAKAGVSVVKQKTSTAIAQERAKAAAVGVASAHMTVGALTRPKEALTYAQTSGALDEGKELADKMADGLMGDLAPTVIDGEYRDTTEEAKALMSDEDAALIEHIKSMTRDAMRAILAKGAEALMLDVEDKTPEEIADEVLKYAPHEYVEQLPGELSNFEKAVAIVESSASVPA